MNRLDSLKNDKKLLVTFVTAGCPDLETTKKLILEMEQKGADVVEIGIPFSDPVADGPVIQQASQVALSQGVRLNDVFSLVADIRKTCEVPLVFLMYYNMIVRYGADAFFKRCAECGLDGVIIPDLPYEERGEIDESLQKYDIVNITLVAPTSKERIQMLTKQARGFVYCVSSLGVTGTRSSYSTDFDQFIGEIKKGTSVPACIGFGISGADQVAEMKKHADGVIIGSAIVHRVLSAESSETAVQNVGKFVSEMRTVLDR